jgi:hypothetical protein
MKRPKPKSKKSWPRKSKSEEQDQIEHAIHGFPHIHISSKGDIKGMKGVEIVSSKGTKPLGEIEKGVEIHEQRHG